MQVWLGIDAGGAHSKILALDQSHKIIKSLEGPSVQLSKQNLEDSVVRLCTLIDRMISTIPSPEVNGIGIGVSGGGRKFICKKLTNQLEMHYPNIPIDVKSNGETAHLQAFGEKDGILITAGSGTIVTGRCGNRWERAGGFGYLIGDWGSGYMMGQDFLKYIAGTLELSPNSSWAALLQDRYNLGSIEDLLEAVYVNKLSPNKFTPLLLELAAKGNKACSRILNDHLQQLAKQVFWVQQKLPQDVNAFSFTGSHATQIFYQKQLKSHILKIIPEAKWIDDCKEPALGAFRLIYGNGVKKK
ncbi:MAG: BadF/BadG/BcrA/BcrD ATPase family protein [Balneolales bacterium]